MKGSTMTAAPPPPHAPHGTASQYQQAQVEEWSRYVALVPIDYYGTRAYNVGDPVPVSAVAEGDPTGEPGAPWIRSEWVSDRQNGGDEVVSQTVPPVEQPTIDPATVAAPVGSAAASLPDESSTDGSTVTSSED